MDAVILSEEERAAGLPKAAKTTRARKTPERRTMTLEEYEALPEEVRVELIGGRVYDMASPTVDHQALAGELYFRFMDYFDKKGGKCKVFIAPLDVELKREPPTIVQPDVMIVCDPEKLGDRRRVYGAPDLAIEVVSPSNEKHDYLRKLNLYMDAGVREYWIVNPQSRQINIYEMKDEKFQTRNWTFKDKVPVGLYPDLWLDFAAISEAAGLE